ncbi:MAG: hypothetical protein ACI3W5_09500 [Faecousia sp.]
MELTEQAKGALKQKMASALEDQRKCLLGFASQNRASAEQIYEALLTEAEETAGYYPEFDLKAELQGEEFMALLRSGLPIRKAYEAVHHQELVQAALHYGAAHALPQRPAENGLSGQATAATPGSMAHSTRQQREDIRSRVSRGETVRL